MITKILYGVLIVYYGYISYYGRSFWNASSERKMTPKGERVYYNHK